MKCLDETKFLLALCISYRDTNLDITSFFDGRNDLGLICYLHVAHR